MLLLFDVNIANVYKDINYTISTANMTLNWQVVISFKVHIDNNVLACVIKSFKQLRLYNIKTILIFL